VMQKMEKDTIKMKKSLSSNRSQSRQRCAFTECSDRTFGKDFVLYNTPGSPLPHTQTHWPFLSLSHPSLLRLPCLSPSVSVGFLLPNGGTLLRSDRPILPL
jgi:hypothetical protein